MIDDDLTSLTYARAPSSLSPDSAGGVDGGGAGRGGGGLEMATKQCSINYVLRSKFLFITIFVLSTILFGDSLNNVNNVILKYF